MCRALRDSHRISSQSVQRLGSALFTTFIPVPGTEGPRRSDADSRLRPVADIGVYGNADGVR